MLSSGRTSCEDRRDTCSLVRLNPTLFVRIATPTRDLTSLDRTIHDTLYRKSVISEVLVLTSLVTPCVLTHKVWNGRKDVPIRPFESTDVPGGTTRMSFVAGVITTLKYLDFGGQIDSWWSILPHFLDTHFRVVQNHSFCVSLVHVCKYHHFHPTI